MIRILFCSEEHYGRRDKSVMKIIDENDIFYTVTNFTDDNKLYIHKNYGWFVVDLHEYDLF